MRVKAGLVAVPLITLAAVVVGRRLPSRPSRTSAETFVEERSVNLQGPIMSIDKILPDSILDNSKDDHSDGPQVLVDLLPRSRAISIFSSLLRDSSFVSRIADEHQNTTILAPSNSAMQAMGHKPWEDSKQYEALGVDAYEGSGGADRAKQNLESFVKRHMVGSSPWLEGQANSVQVCGRKLWWTMDGKKRVVMPDQVEVDRVESTTSNGEIWVLKAVLGE